MVKFVITSIPCWLQMASFMGEIEGLLKDKDQLKASDGKPGHDDSSNVGQGSVVQSQDATIQEQSEDMTAPQEASGKSQSHTYLLSSEATCPLVSQQWECYLT